VDARCATRAGRGGGVAPRQQPPHPTLVERPHHAVFVAHVRGQGEGEREDALSEGRRVPA